MRLNSTLLFSVLLLWSMSAALCQSSKEVEALYDSFLELEFEDSDLAKSKLDEGLSMARKLQDKSLIAFGHKYTAWYYDDVFEDELSMLHVDSSIHYFTLAGDKEELGNAYNFKGNLLSDIALLDSSLVFYFKALDIATEMNDYDGMNKVSNNIGLVYADLGEYLTAIDYFHQSIDLSKSQKDDESLGDVYNNIGSLFTSIEDYEQAMTYHKMALEIREKSDDPVRLSSVLLNIGRIHLTLAEYEMARSYFNQSLTIDEGLEDLEGIALNYNNIGLTYFLDDQLDSAKKYYDLSLAYRLELDDPFGLVMSYNNLGEYYNKIKDYKKAITHCKKAYDIASESKMPYEKVVSCNCLSIAYDKTGQINLAYQYLKEYLELEEFLSTEKNQKELTKNEMQYVFHYQNLEDSLRRAELQSQKDAAVALQIKQSELEREQALSEKRNQLFLFVLVGLFLIALAAILFNGYKKQKRKTQLIHEKNEFIRHQKSEIDQSIEYARLIQQTSLPSLELTHLFKSAFLFYQPRDGVSGDFYWLEDTEEHSFFAVADCTGHGIPGAFISMMGTILLNEIYNSKLLREPNEILDELNRLVELTLLGREGKQMKDGMDIAFCRLDKKEKVLHFSGANNPLWIISEKDTLTDSKNGMAQDPVQANLSLGTKNLFEIKADKQPIGKYADVQKKFTKHSLSLSENDEIYIFTDGFPDQFGGPEGKKYKYKPFKQFLLSLAQKSASDQYKNMSQEFESWKGDLEQIDDVCIIGVRL